MAKLRTTLLIAVVAATAISAIAGYFVLNGSGGRLLVDAGLAIALAAIVAVMLSPTVNRVDSLVEALRALARGEKHQRVRADEFAGLADVARAMNEVAASLTEGDDPNLGPVRSEPRPGHLPTHTVKKQVPLPAIDDDPEVSAHPEIGPVRVLKKRAGAPDNGERPQTAAPTNDTNVDEKVRSDIKDDIAQVPSRAELESLFQEFVAAKKSHEEGVADLDFDAFAQTIQGECERLISAHQCKGVRFEVTMQDGEVSLRPRLLR